MWNMQQEVTAQTMLTHFCTGACWAKCTCLVSTTPHGRSLFLILLLQLPSTPTTCKSRTWCGFKDGSLKWAKLCIHKVGLHVPAALAGSWYKNLQPTRRDYFNFGQQRNHSSSCCKWRRCLVVPWRGEGSAERWENQDGIQYPERKPENTSKIK